MNCVINSLKYEHIYLFHEKMKTASLTRQSQWAGLTLVWCSPLVWFEVNSLETQLIEWLTNCVFYNVFLSTIN